MYLFDMLTTGLTQLVTTSKTCQKTGVNLVVKLVTFKMDLEAQTAPLRKKLRSLLGN